MDAAEVKQTIELGQTLIIEGDDFRYTIFRSARSDANEPRWIMFHESFPGAYDEYITGPAAGQWWHDFKSLNLRELEEKVREATGGKSIDDVLRSANHHRQMNEYSFPPRLSVKIEDI